MAVSGERRHARVCSVETLHRVAAQYCRPPRRQNVHNAAGGGTNSPLRRFYVAWAMERANLSEECFNEIEALDDVDRRTPGRDPGGSRPSNPTRRRYPGKRGRQQPGAVESAQQGAIRQGTEGRAEPQCAIEPG